MICPHCSKRIDDEHITRYLGFVDYVESMESAASTMGQKGGRSRSPRKLATLAKNRYRGKLTPKAKAEIRASSKSGAQEARDRGVSPSLISRIRKGLR
jgi:hypothetical protein